MSAKNPKLEAIQNLQPGVMFYENVKGAAQKCKDKHGNIHRPATEVIQEDMDAMQFQAVLRLSSQLCVD